MSRSKVRSRSGSTPITRFAASGWPPGRCRRSRRCPRRGAGVPRRSRGWWSFRRRSGRRSRRRTRRARSGRCRRPPVVAELLDQAADTIAAAPRRRATLRRPRDRRAGVSVSAGLSSSAGSGFDAAAATGSSARRSALGLDQASTSGLRRRGEGLHLDDRPGSAAPRACGLVRRGISASLSRPPSAPQPPRRSLRGSICRRERRPLPGSPGRAVRGVVVAAFARAGSPPASLPAGGRALLRRRGPPVAPAVRFAGARGAFAFTAAALAAGPFASSAIASALVDAAFSATALRWRRGCRLPWPACAWPRQPAPRSPASSFACAVSGAGRGLLRGRLPGWVGGEESWARCGRPVRRHPLRYQSVGCVPAATAPKQDDCANSVDCASWESPCTPSRNANGPVLPRASQAESLA